MAPRGTAVSTKRPQVWSARERFWRRPAPCSRPESRGLCSIDRFMTHISPQCAGSIAAPSTRRSRPDGDMTPTDAPSSRRAKGVPDPDDAVRTVGHALDGQHIEAHCMGAPLCLPPQEILSGANDLALLAPCDRGKRSAEIALCSLPHLDDRQHI